MKIRLNVLANKKRSLHPDEMYSDLWQEDLKGWILGADFLTAVIKQSFDFLNCKDTDVFGLSISNWKKWA